MRLFLMFHRSGVEVPTTDAGNQTSQVVGGLGISPPTTLRCLPHWSALFGGEISPKSPADSLPASLAFAHRAY